MLKTDIIICTMNRLHLLKQTINHIVDRTETPYRLHVMDNNSDRMVSDYLVGLLYAGILSSVFLSNERRGRMANRNMATWLAFSDPFVLVDDDILCPKLKPDWLSQGLDAMRQRSELGILALNHPDALRRDYDEDEKVIYCEVVGNTFMFVRRGLVERWNHPHFAGNYGVTDEMQRCQHAHDLGYRVGYMKNVNCYHMGKINADGGPSTGPFKTPKNWETLEI
jgi:hypothetical protein